jgi:hypothetical protein
VSPRHDGRHDLLQTRVLHRLAPGASETGTIDPPLQCHGWTSFVDDLNQVDETDETNNTRGIGEVIC